MDIYIKDLQMKYDNKLVLNISEFKFKSGKIYGIVGPNGSGKTTLLKIIAGLKESTKGIIKYNDKCLDDSMYKYMTYAEQKPYMLRTTVYKNITYPLKIRGYKSKNIRLKVNEIMKELEIEHLSNQKAYNLSGGETQKVALARALVFNPKLLLLDEPTANIDPESIELMERAIVKRNKEENMTILIITHSISQAARICNETIFLRDGKLIEHSNTNNLIFNPRKTETKKFISLEYNVI